MSQKTVPDSFFFGENKKLYIMVQLRYYNSVTKKRTKGCEMKMLEDPANFNKNNIIAEASLLFFILEIDTLPL